MGRYNKGASTNLVHIISDCLFGALAFILVSLCYECHIMDHLSYYLIACFTFMIIYILSSKESRLYNVTTFFYVDRILRFVIKSFLIAAGVTSTLLFYVGNTKVNRVFYVLFLAVVLILLVMSAFLSRYFLKHKMRNAPRVILIGDIENFDKFEKYLYKSNYDVNIVGYLSSLKSADKRYLGCINEFEKIVHFYGIDQVYIMQSRQEDLDIQSVISICMDMGITIRVIMNMFHAENAQSYVSSVGTYPVLTYHRVSLNASSRALKRVVDIIGSVVGIVLSSPLMLIVAIAIKIDSKGPIIFKQKRVGLNGRIFYMYKFRSMCTNAEALKKTLESQNEMDSGGLMFKIKNDPRVTKVGKIIRKTSLDELPQFFNVFLGDMSLVGTRPPTLDEVEHYERIHWRRMSIKPGITGMWQVSGRNVITEFDDIVELDTEYIDKWNVLLDFQIMLKTVFQVLRRKGAY